MNRCILVVLLFLIANAFAEQDALLVDSVSTNNLVDSEFDEQTLESSSSSLESNIVVQEPSSSSLESNYVVLDTSGWSLVQKPAAVETKKSGLMNSLFTVDPDEAIAKGNLFGGVSLFLLQGSTDDDALNILFGDIYEAEGYMFTVEAFGGYFISDAMALALRGGYSRTKYDIDFKLMEDLLDVSEHRQYVSNGFFVTPYLKNYLKVLDSKNIYFFNETSVSFEYSYGISQSDDGEDLNKTRNKSYSIDVGINPGLSIMVLDKLAFETSVGLLGLSSTIMDIEENGERHSKVTFNMVSFTINLLALSFSLVTFF